MEKMRFLTGSSACPKDPSTFEFRLFDYLIDRSIDKVMHADVNSGVDAEGPGIYAFGQPDDEPFEEWQIDGANNYSGKDGKGAVFGFDVNMVDWDDEEITFIDEYPPDEIPEEDWVAAIHDVMDELRRLDGYEVDEEDIEGYDYDDPASVIYDEGGPEQVVRSAIERSENLWETLKRIWNTTACISTGKGLFTYNRTFERAVINNVRDNDKLRVAQSKNKDFYVIFDTSEAKIKYANTFKYEVDEGAFKPMMDEIGDMLSRYREQIEPHQLALKINEISRSHFNVDFNDDIVKDLSSCENRYDFEDALLNRIKESVGELTYSEWERFAGEKRSYGVKEEMEEPAISTEPEPKKMTLR